MKCYDMLICDGEDGDVICPIRADHGEWVRWEDHHAEVIALKEELVDEVQANLRSLVANNNFRKEVEKLREENAQLKEDLSTEATWYAEALRQNKEIALEVAALKSEIESLRSDTAVRELREEISSRGREIVRLREFVEAAKTAKIALDHQAFADKEVTNAQLKEDLSTEATWYAEALRKNKEIALEVAGLKAENAELRETIKDLRFYIRSATKE